MLLTSTEPASAGFRFFVFTSRDPQSDFRRPLVDALRQYHGVYYIWMRRRPVVTGPDHASPASEMSLPALLKFLARLPNHGEINVYFNSTDVCFPGLMVFIRAIARRGIWCLDMHDDLRYYYRGLRRIQKNLAVAVSRESSHVVVHAAPTLLELFPESYLLGNASHILPLSHDNVDPADVLILTSFDERFDFDFMARLATLSAQTRFHIHGWTQNSDPGTLKRVSRLTCEHANVLYHRPYTTDDLPAILRSYWVTVAPYRTNSPRTRYIDPLRFYHCLNAGLEIISTDIPQARSIEPWIHIARDAEDCAETLKRIQAGVIFRQSSFVPITWNQRVLRLMDIINSLDRTRMLRARQIGDQAVIAPDAYASPRNSDQ